MVMDTAINVLEASFLGLVAIHAIQQLSVDLKETFRRVRRVADRLSAARFSPEQRETLFVLLIALSSAGALAPLAYYSLEWTLRVAVMLRTT